MLMSTLFISSLLLTLAMPLFLALILVVSTIWVKELNFIERFSYGLVRFSFISMTFFSICSCILWTFLGFIKGSYDVASYDIGQFSINIRIFYDIFGLLFLLTSSIITNLIAFYSRRYLHRDPHYRRFFIVISFFSFGMNLLILAGTMDLIFAGFEIVGISSFLLISYFWHRPKAVAAAVRAYSIYRFCDLGFLASLLITHFFWHDKSLFNDLFHPSTFSVWAHVPNMWRFILSICILLPVLGKSAQIPFCYWLPKAMEGPTQSSAIYYGSLSIHAGVFLLLRTMPIWQDTPGFIYLLAFIGLATAFCATLFAQVQTNIKGQIGYASIAQVGLMLFELSQGFHNLAFFHMIGNAFLRCFQLLVSPSIVTTHLYMQSFVNSFRRITNSYPFRLLPLKWQTTIYAFALNDGYFEFLIMKYIVSPVFYISYMCNALLNRYLVIPFLEGLGIRRRSPRKGVSLFSIGPTGIILLSFALVGIITPALGLLSLATALLMAICALGEQEEPSHALMFAIISYVFAFMGLATGRLESLYAIGLLVSSFLAIDALHFMKNRCSLSHIDKFSGLYGQFPFAANLFLVGLLGVGAFPISATFFGEDFLMSVAIKSGPIYLVTLHVIFMINGVTLIRLYAKTMFGLRDNVSPALNLDFKNSQVVARMFLFITGNILAFLIPHW